MREETRNRVKLTAPADSVFRQVGCWLYGCYVWCMFLPVVLVCGALSILLRRPTQGRRIAHYGCRLLFKLAGIPLSVAGLDHLPLKPHVLLANHTSFLDPLVLLALLPTTPGYAFTTRQEFRIQSLLCPLLKSVGVVVLASPGEHSGPPNIERMAAILRLGRNLVVFPEGGFRPEPGVQEFHSGAFVAAARARAPLFCAGLRGTRDALRLGTWMPRRIPIHLVIGPVLTVPENADPTTMKQVIDAARDAIATLSDESEA
jgi:1-acyl-sn-glycerol-3-phosphate acyltransferase